MRLRTATYDKPNDGTGGNPPAPPAVTPPAGDPPAAPPAAPPASPLPPEPPKKDWKDDRIAKLTHDLNEARRAAAAAPPPVIAPGETEAQFQARVDEAANAKAGVLAAQADWDRQCNSVAELGRQEFPDFDARIKAMNSTINPQDQAEVIAQNEIISAAIETGAAHKVLYAIGSDPAEFQRLMKLSPVKRAMELGKLAVTLVNDKPPSNLPKPIVPVNSGGVHYEGIAPDDPQKGMKLPKGQWFKMREEQARAKGIQ